MSKEKLGIVSSYDELCGNAGYTKSLVEGLSEFFDVTVISINVDLLRKGDSEAAELHISQICEQLKSFDCVNIQFEALLFGTKTSTIIRRLEAIFSASKKIAITLHRFHGKEKHLDFKNLINLIFQRNFRFVLEKMRVIFSNNRYVPLYNKIIKLCKKKNAAIILHTKRDSELLKIKYKYDNVYHHPLGFYDQNYVETIRRSCSREEFCNKFGLDENKIYIGIFGFIDKYKGHETLINALEFLPKNYEVLIFGSQHPLSINLGEEINPFIRGLMNLIEKKKLTERVKFCGSLNDVEFLKALICCDFNVLPYLEVNQGGSGIAAITLESRSKSIFSQNRVFLELAKYAPNAFKMFSIGNYIELAHAIKTYNQADYLPDLERFLAKYNIQTSAGLYKRLLSMHQPEQEIARQTHYASDLNQAS